MGHNQIVHATDSSRPESARKVTQIAIWVLLGRQWDLRQEIMIRVHVWSGTSSPCRVRCNLFSSLLNWWAILAHSRSVRLVLHKAAPWTENLWHFKDRFDLFDILKGQLDGDIIKQALEQQFDVGDFSLQDSLLRVLNLFKHGWSLFCLGAIIFENG